MISENEFNILVNIIKSNFDNNLLNKNLALLTKYKIDNLIDNDIEEIKNKILHLLEPFKVKRAIILAAGFGSRMMPLTSETPKPLVKVLNKSFIETQLDALIDNGIKDIIIVTGYKADKVEAIKNAYSSKANISLIRNDYYNKANNILSIFQVRHYLSNSLIVEGDLYISNTNIFNLKYSYNPFYCGIYKKETDDWVYKINNENNMILDYVQNGKNCYQMIGISFYPSYISNTIALALEKVVLSEKIDYTKMFFDDVTIGKYKSTEPIFKVRPLNENDIIEIDSYQELMEFRKKYEKI